MALACDRQNRVERAADVAGHVFGADQRPMELLQHLHMALEVLRPSVVVKADHIGLLNLDARQRWHGGKRTPVAVPQAAGERLRGMRGAGPRIDLRQQAKDDLVFVFRVAFCVGAVVAVVGLIPKIPRKNPRIVGECAHHALHVAPKPRILRRVFENRSAGRLHPARVVYARNRWVLRSKLRIGVPARVEQDKDRTDMMARRDGQERIDPLCKSLRVLLPKQVVKEDAHGVHADAFGPPEFAVNCGRIKRVGLPHLQFVDGGGRQKVRAHRPRLPCIPRIGLRLAPALARSGNLLAVESRGQRNKQHNSGNAAEELQLRQAHRDSFKTSS